MENQVNTQQEMATLNEQFGEFLRTKGIVAKFKLAFANMGASLEAQREADRARMEEIKNSEENRQFVQFLQTKGFKAKFNLVIENIKKGAREANERTQAQIAATKARTQASIDAARNVGVAPVYTAQTLEEEFNAFLKSKGLDGKYTVVITEE